MKLWLTVLKYGRRSYRHKYCIFSTTVVSAGIGFPIPSNTIKKLVLSSSITTGSYHHPWHTKTKARGYYSPTIINNIHTIKIC
jgi:hypothetical protein